MQTALNSPKEGDRQEAVEQKTGRGCKLRDERGCCSNSCFIGTEWHIYIKRRTKDGTEGFSGAEHCFALPRFTGEWRAVKDPNIRPCINRKDWSVFSDCDRLIVQSPSRLVF